LHENSVGVDTEIGWSVKEDDSGAYLDGSFEVVNLDAQKLLTQ
jgi:hypothetical protein